MKRACVLWTLVTVCAIAISRPAGAVDLAWLGDRAAVHEFVDGVLAAQIATDAAVGATVSIVHSGEIVLAQGYGVADRANGTPVDATSTLFRIGSVSKVFVWIAVMQQVSASRLDLNTDVNTYLKDFQIPETFPEPITLTHLMAHTAGFEDRAIGMLASGPRTIGDFQDNLIAMLPRRIWMPGSHAAYSNYGAALAGHLVEIAAKQDWDDYIDVQILKPLGMSDTTARQPVPAPLKDRIAHGYRLESGRYVEQPFEFITIPPAGSVSSTAADMARLMIELLAHGDTAVLSSAARAQLFAPAYQHDKRLARMLHGMYEHSSHGQTLVEHNGGTLAFHTILMLCPALDLGLFASYNDERGGLAYDGLQRAFLDRVFGRPEPPVKSDRSVSEERYRGFYVSLREPQSGHDKIKSLLETFHVGVEDGELVLPGAEAPRRFVRVDDDLFASEDGRERVAFRGDGGQAEYLFVDSAPPIDLARVAPRDNPLLHAALVGAALLLCAGVWLAWPFSSWRHRRRVAETGEARSTLLAMVTSALIIGFFAILAMSLVHDNEFAFALPQDLERALWIPLALAPLLLLQLAYGYRAWVGGLWWPARRIHYTLLTFASIAFVVWAFYWHLTAVIVDF